MKWAGRIGVLAGVFVTLGCHSNEIVGPPPPPPPPPAPFTAPPIRGTVRETNGGPIGGIWVEMVGVVFAQSDAQGVFVFPRPSNMCGIGRSVELSIDSYWIDFLFGQAQVVSCTNASAPPEVSLELKLQRNILLSVGQSVETVLTNDDLYWPVGEAGEGPCGPCKVVFLALPARASTVTLDWSGPDPLRAWLTGWDANNKKILLAQRTAAVGDHQLQVQLPAPLGVFGGAAVVGGATLNVGLPYASAATGGLSDASTIHIDLR